jgi:succinyl-CoA synthetase, beta subunit
MKIHEYQAKELFSSYDIPVEKYILCHDVSEVSSGYDRLATEKAVVKAQVLTGGRGKAGGVKIVHNKQEATEQAERILQMTIKGLPVKKVLLSEAVNIASEYYVSFAIDRNNKSVLLMLSPAGGMDIESVAKSTPERIYRFNIDPFIGIPDYLARRFAFTLFDTIEQVSPFSRLLQNLYRLFIEKDASLTEINPLVLTVEGRLIAIDAKITFDSNAFYRQSAIQSLFEPDETEKKEITAKEKGFSYVQLDGEIGCMVNGAGLAMATMDMIKLYGGNPANFLDVGGSSNPDKVVDAITLLLQDSRVKSVLINIFGGITRCDDIAMGLLKAFDQIQTAIPVIVRLTGTNEEEGRALLRNSRFLVAETMSEAARMSIESSRSR